MAKLDDLPDEIMLMILSNVHPWPCNYSMWWLRDVAAVDQRWRDLSYDAYERCSKFWRNQDAKRRVYARWVRKASEVADFERRAAAYDCTWLGMAKKWVNKTGTRYGSIRIRRFFRMTWWFWQPFHWTYHPMSEEPDDYFNDDINEHCPC